MSAARKQTLKSKLLRLVVSTTLAVGGTTLAAFGWTSHVVERQRLDDLDRNGREMMTSKAATLASSHALALRGLVSDNAFGDVKELVRGAVKLDADVIYGLYLGPDGTPWAYVSPSHADVEPDDPGVRQAITSLGIDESAARRTKFEERGIEAFGQEIREFSAPVVNGAAGVRARDRVERDVARRPMTPCPVTFRGAR